MSKRFHDWEEVYNTRSNEEMGWYWPELDKDLSDTLVKRKIRNGKFLDIGTGPGTQAQKLVELGFEVTATDIAEKAIDNARLKYPDVDFIQDDILNSKLSGKYNYIFDRGCFHTIDPDQRKIYMQQLYKLLDKNGILFLKCFSIKEPDKGTGPYRFSKRMIIELFKNQFNIEIIKDSVYQGTRNPHPRAIFSALLRN